MMTFAKGNTSTLLFSSTSSCWGSLLFLPERSNLKEEDDN